MACRYFTGNSKDANENVLFVAGTTKVGPAIDGAIQIVNVAVCIYFLVDGLSVCARSYLYLYVEKFITYQKYVDKFTYVEIL